MNRSVIRLHSVSHGCTDDPPIVLASGLAQQLTSWPMGLVHGIVVGGYRVVRFDNRDMGLSDRTPGAKIKLADVVFGDPATAPYTIETMADDTVRMLDDLGIDRAHVVGHSMGGMIGQAVAARFPERVRSLVSLMSTTGAVDVGQPTEKGSHILYAPLPADRERAIQRIADNELAWSTPGALDEQVARGKARFAYDRGYDTAGVGRQLAAIRASGDRTPSLRRITAPTLVVHGTADPIIDVSGGRATADAIQSARYLELEGVAHDLPRVIWPELLRAMHDHWASSPP